MKMARKTIACYSAPQENESNRSLRIDIGLHHVACAVSENDQPLAFEYFELDNEINTWNDIFFELKQQSVTLGQHYQQVTLHYHGMQALVIPREKWSTEAGEDYLTMVHGKLSGYHTRQEKGELPGDLYTIYRMEEQLHDQALRHFPLHQTQHIYTTVLNQLFKRRDIGGQFMQVTFYHGTLLFVLLKEERLQYIQVLPYSNADDVCYHVLHVAQQYGVEASEAYLEIAGVIEANDPVVHRLSELFPRAVWHEGNLAGTLNREGYPAYYFTPFFNTGS